jgi:hypothetical protein
MTKTTHSGTLVFRIPDIGASRSKRQERAHLADSLRHGKCQIRGISDDPYHLTIKKFHIIH